jgi:hypothetical protein
MKLSHVAAEIDAATKELKAHNDLMDERDLIRATDRYIEEMREFRKSIRPHADSVTNNRPDNVGLIVGNFIYHYGARK